MVMLVAALIRADMAVRCVVRDPEKRANRFPGVETVKADLRYESAAERRYWTEALTGVATPPVSCNRGGGATLPPEYHQAFKLWFILGWPAFLGLAVVFALMVMKPDL